MVEEKEAWVPENTVQPPSLYRLSLDFYKKKKLTSILLKLSYCCVGVFCNTQNLILILRGRSINNKVPLRFNGLCTEGCVQGDEGTKRTEGE